MREIARTNNIVLISVVEAMFDDSGIGYFIADQHMSVLEGSTGFMMRRIMVASNDFAQARRLLQDTGLMEQLAHG